MNQSARNKLGTFAINLENYNRALVNSLKIMLKCHYIISLFPHPTLFQNVVIYNFDKKTFFIKSLACPYFPGAFSTNITTHRIFSFPSCLIFLQY